MILQQVLEQSEGFEQTKCKTMKIMQAFYGANEKYWDEAQSQYNNSFHAAADLKKYVHVSVFYFSIPINIVFE